MKRLFTFWVLFLLIPVLLSACGSGGGGNSNSSAASGTCVNIAGIWITTEQINYADCGGGIYTDNNTYKVTQNGCNVTVTHINGNFNGTVNGNKVSLTGSYPDEGGTATIDSMTLTVAANGTSFSGSSSWIWSKGNNSCSGTTQFNGTRDTTAPSVPTGLTASAIFMGQINLGWNESTDNDHFYYVKGYKVYRDSVYLQSVNSTWAIDTGLTPSTQYCYQVSAYDTSGNESEKSSPVCATTLADTTAPSVPTGLTAAAVSTSQINLLWIASGDNVGVTEYKIYRDGTYLKSVTTTSTSDTGLTPSTQYCYQVSAYDTSGNESGLTTPVCTTTYLWPILTIDSTEDVGQHTSIAIDSNNKVHISYYDSTNDDLKYATNASGSWVTNTIDDTGNVGQYTSIAIDSNNKIHISYYDFSNGELKYATNASGSWVTNTIDDTGNVGQYTSIAIDSNNKVYISYSYATYSKLKYATNASGSWATYTLDNHDDNTSIAIDTNNKVHISYNDYDYDYYDPINNLKYATNASGSWATYTIETGIVGKHTSIAVDSNNTIHISYYDITNQNLKYATNASGSWATYTIDDTGILSWVKTNTDIAIDTNNKVHISYYDYANGDLKYATNASGSWNTYTVESTGNVGMYTSIAIDSNNKIHISYYDSNNGDLKYATNQ